MGLRGLLLGLMVAAPSGAAADCVARDFMAMDLPSGEPVAVALEQAYPGVTVADGAVRLPGGEVLPMGVLRAVEPEVRLASATIAEQFTYRYPLDFSLSQRVAPHHDPGRIRNDALFRTLWFADRRTARGSLATVRFPGGVRARFSVTTRFCVHAQLQAALDEIAGLGPEMDHYFRKIGGSFNWRNISGTDRLSAHSFGTAVDINTELGQYWRWSGAQIGEAAAYDNRIPEPLVHAFERYGFIWGGKWHHFDGMHFEYRPELILHSRLTS